MVETQLCTLRGTSMFHQYRLPATAVQQYKVVAQNLRKVVRACYMFDPHLMKDIPGRSVTRLDVVRVNRTIFHSIIMCADTIKQLKNVSCEYD